MKHIPVDTSNLKFMTVGTPTPQTRDGKPMFTRKPVGRCGTCPSLS